MLDLMLDNVRRSTPLIHNITNYVTVNDCANILLAIGASPIMADEPDEAAEITSLCGGLCINIGTLNRRAIDAMFISANIANDRGIPVLLDPVGAGASALRTNTSLSLLDKARFSVIRGNISEISALATGSGAARGVDVNMHDVRSLDNTIALAKSFSKKTGAVIIITGAVDVVADAETAYSIYNGDPMMSSVTGTGCMLSAMTTGYIAANPDNLLCASAAAVCAMGICGENARQALAENEGNASYAKRIIDAAYDLRGADIAAWGKYEKLN